MAVSSKDVQPINRFIDLFNTNKLPSLLNDGVMDPKILKHYLLVHDNQDGPADRYICYFLFSFLCIMTCHIILTVITFDTESWLPSSREVEIFYISVLLIVILCHHWDGVSVFLL